MKEYSYALFDDYNTFTDFNLYIEKLEITEAEVKTEIVNLPRLRWRTRFFIFIDRRSKI